MKLKLKDLKLKSFATDPRQTRAGFEDLDDSNGGPPLCGATEEWSSCLPC
ncbi:MAG: hypothetical protein QNK37_22540 [Acidobacteriota bacterium]|nr:hypothetical protein [Acidobacteriota bacterium]